MNSGNSVYTCVIFDTCLRNVALRFEMSVELQYIYAVLFFFILLYSVVLLVSSFCSSSNQLLLLFTGNIVRLGGMNKKKIINDTKRWCTMK